MKNKSTVMNPVPTKRAYIDTGRLCNTRCLFCYHKYEVMVGYKSLEKLKREVNQIKDRGCNYIDLTGGEPTIIPTIPEIIKYALEKGIKICVITNGIDKRNIKQLLEAGVDDFLISVHGMERIHDYTTQCNKAWARQREFMDQLKGRINFRFNFVITKWNQHEILDVAKDMITRVPSIVNFINFQPQSEWIDHPLETEKVIADLRLVEPLLNEAIELLEKNNIGVNVRYYPMCRIDKKYRRCICNDKQVMFDPYEWDYATMPKTLERYIEKSNGMSNANEYKGEPCNICDLFKICGGVNRIVNKITRGQLINIISENEIDKKDFYSYRKYNVMTLKEKNS